MKNDFNVELNQMNDIRQINKILGFIPLIPIIPALIILLTGLTIVNRMPEPDLASYIFDTLNVISVGGLILCFLSIPTWVMLTLHLLINRVKFTKMEIVSLLTSVFCIVVLLVFIIAFWI